MQYITFSFHVQGLSKVFRYITVYTEKSFAVHSNDIAEL